MHFFGIEVSRHGSYAGKVSVDQHTCQIKLPTQSMLWVSDQPPALLLTWSKQDFPEGQTIKPNIPEGRTIGKLTETPSATDYPRECAKRVGLVLGLNWEWND
jgi:hypothetical protein